MASNELERRRWPRFVANLAAVVQHGGPGADLRSLIVNASEGGMFLALDPPPDVGTQLVIEIPAAAEAPAMVVAGRVARRLVAPKGAPMPSGVGVEISNRTPEWLAFCARLAAAKPPAP